MITIENGLRVQRPSVGWWLYSDIDNKRVFTDMVYLGKEESEWAECTEAEKVAWEEAHKPEEPQEPIEE